MARPGPPAPAPKRHRQDGEGHGSAWLSVREPDHSGRDEPGGKHPSRMSQLPRAPELERLQAARGDSRDHEPAQRVLVGSPEQRRRLEPAPEEHHPGDDRLEGQIYQGGEGCGADDECPAPHSPGEDEIAGGDHQKPGERHEDGEELAVRKGDVRQPPVGVLVPPERERAVESENLGAAPDRHHETCGRQGSWPPDPGGDPGEQRHRPGAQEDDPCIGADPAIVDPEDPNGDGFEDRQATGNKGDPEPETGSPAGDRSRTGPRPGGEAGRRSGER